MKTWSRGTNSRLPFSVNMTRNYSSSASSLYLRSWEKRVGKWRRKISSPSFEGPEENKYIKVDCKSIKKKLIQQIKPYNSTFSLHWNEMGKLPQGKVLNVLENRYSLPKSFETQSNCPSVTHACISTSLPKKKIGRKNFKDPPVGRCEWAA